MQDLLDQHEAEIEDQDASPPLFGTWQKFYAVILIVHALIIFVFWLFSNAYS